MPQGFLSTKLKMHAEDRAQSQAEDEADAMRNRDEAKVERLRRRHTRGVLEEPGSARDDLGNAILG